MAKENREAYREGKWVLRMLRLSRWPEFSHDRINHHGKRRAGRWARYWDN